MTLKTLILKNQLQKHHYLEKLHIITQNQKMNLNRTLNLYSLTRTFKNPPVLNWEEERRHETEKPAPVILTKRLINWNMKHKITLHRKQKGIRNQKLFTYDQLGEPSNSQLLN